jgi:hypothetical protein
VPSVQGRDDNRHEEFCPIRGSIDRSVGILDVLFCTLSPALRFVCGRTIAAAVLMEALGNLRRGRAAYLRSDRMYSTTASICRSSSV